MKAGVGRMSMEDTSNMGDATYLSGGHGTGGTHFQVLKCTMVIDPG